MQAEDSGATFIPASQRPDGTWRKQRRVKDGYVPQEEVPLYESKGKQWAKTQPKLPVGMNFVETPEVTPHKADKPKQPQYVIPGLLVEEAEPTNKVELDGKKKKKKKKKSKGAGEGPGSNDVLEKLSNMQVSGPKSHHKDSSNAQSGGGGGCVSSGVDQDEEASSKGGQGGGGGGGGGNQQNAHSHQNQHHQPSAPLTELEMMEKKLRKLKDKLRDIEGLEKKIETGELKNPDKKQLEKIQRKAQILAEIEDLVIEIELAD